MLVGCIVPLGARADEDEGIEFFEKQVRPLLIARCYECHSIEAGEPSGGLYLDHREGWMAGGDSGPVIVPHDPDASELIKAVRYADDGYQMPPSGKLADEEIAILENWVRLGAPDPRQADAPRVAAKSIDMDAGKQFWSFQPLTRLEPPRVANDSWCQTPIDQFILAKLEEAALRPAPPADRRKLIRRAYLDLLGMPPSPAEVEAFLADEQPEAFVRLVDRLLASPHYGERWGRYWLDLARFAESHGFEHDYDRKTAYHFRDFVIRAFNEDLPFHTFVRWQLAGDELAPDNHLAMLATGFLAAGVHSTQITANQAEKERYDELDDMLSTTGTAMLGLTIGCARCHDHKFDPIPQRDYYRLLSTFTTTVRSELDLPIDPEGDRVARAEYEAQHEPYLRALANFEAMELPSRFAQWEAGWSERRDQYVWHIPNVVQVESAGGAAFEPWPDGSLQVTGKNPDHDTFTFTLETPLSAVTGLRIEALADPSLAAGGPGRGDNGNFALTSVHLAVAAAENPASQAEVLLTNPQATFEQAGLPIAAALDDDPTTGWAIDPQFGRDHAAVFELVQDVGFVDGSIYTLKLEFKNNVRHAMGRIRISLTSAPRPVSLSGEIIPAEVVALLDAPAEQRSAEQAAELLAWYRHVDAKWQRLDAARREHEQQAPRPRTVKALISSEGTEPVRLHTQGPDFYEQTYFLIRGDTSRKDGVAEPGYLQVLLDAPRGEAHWKIEPPAGGTTSFRRAALAHWITDLDAGAGALLARVMANRLWQGHFGHGIVATPNDFGTQGAAPTHPELLDWLATEMIAGGWRLKRMHRLIMFSAAYQQDSVYDASGAAVDPENELCWRFTPRRLEAEAIRDSLLTISGQLDPMMYGPGTLDQASRRRSIYFTIKRSELIPFMQVFDAPDALQGVAERPTTTIAPQALLLMNSPLVRSYARSMAERLEAEADLAQAVNMAYRIALVREPSAEELSVAQQFIAAQRATYEQQSEAEPSEVSRLALADFCQVLMCLNEFVYLD